MVRLLALALLSSGALGVRAEVSPFAKEPPPASLLVELGEAEYPPEALFSGREADVPCIVELDARGAALNARCEGEDRPLARAAARALKASKFKPVPVWGPGVEYRIVWRWALSQVTLDNAGPVAKEPVWDTSLGRVLHGTILQAGSRVPVQGGEVALQGLGITAASDANGRFTITVPPGQVLLTGSAANYFNGQTVVDLSGKEPEATLYLRPKDVSGLSVNIIEHKIARASTKVELDREELRNVPGTQGDPVRVLETLPGLARVPYNGGALIVRGGDAQDTGAYVDGQRIPQLYHLLQGPSVLGEDMVDRIDFYPGGAGAYYGRNLAGVVAVTTRKGDAERYHGGASIDLQKSSAYLQGPVDASTQFAVGGRVSYVNPLIKLILPAGTSQAVPVYWDYQGRVDHKLGEHDRLQLTIFGSNDHLDTIGDQRGSVNISDNQQNGFHRARLAWEHGIGDALSLTVAPAIGWDTSGTTLLGQVQAARPQTASSSAFSSGGRIELGWKPARFLDLRGGTDITFDRVSYQQDLLFDEQLRGLGAPNAEQKQVQGLQLFESFAEYLETELRAGPLKLTPGVRVDVVHYTGRTFLRTDPRVWARVGGWTGAAFFGYWGVYHQAPQAAQLDGNTGNPGLLPLRADQVGGGLEQRVNADWSFKIEGWHVWRQNLVFPVAASRLPDGTYSNPLLANSGRGEAYGLELLIRKELTGKVYGWVSYTLSQSRQQARRGEVWEATPFDQPHVFTMLLGLRLSPYVEFASKVRIASGNPLTTLTRVTFNADSGDYVAAQSPLGTDRLPTFVQIDFEVNNVWVSDLFNMQLYVDFQNVLARDNPEALIYDYRYLRTAYVRGTPLSAAVGARVAF